jgi:hypothetical protein
MSKNYAMGHIEKADSEISFGKMVKRYFVARDDLAACSEDEHDFMKHELELCENKIKNRLFEMWREGRISTKFE